MSESNRTVVELLLNKSHVFDAGALYETLREDLESYEGGASGWSRGQVEFMYAYTEAFDVKHDHWRGIEPDEPLTVLEAVLELAEDGVAVVDVRPSVNRDMFDVLATALALADADPVAVIEDAPKKTWRFDYFETCDTDPASVF